MSVAQPPPKIRTDVQSYRIRLLPWVVMIRRWFGYGWQRVGTGSLCAGPAVPPPRAACARRRPGTGVGNLTAITSPRAWSPRHGFTHRSNA